MSFSQSLTADVARQTDREKLLQTRYAELVATLKELTENGETQAVYANGSNGN